MRHHHLQLAIPRAGEDEGRAFFVGVLGLTEVPKPEALASRGGVWFRGPGYEVHLGVDEPFSPARKAHPAFVLDDADAQDDLAERLAAAGHTVDWVDDVPGWRRFYTADPFGNRIEILVVGDR